MLIIGNAQAAVLMLLAFGAFGLHLVAAIDCLRYRNEVYVAANKKSKNMWAIILWIALALSFVTLPPLGLRFPLINLLAIVALAVYFVDVRPALRRVDPRFNRQKRA